jgi:hypothetical protein
MLVLIPLEVFIILTISIIARWLTELIVIIAPTAVGIVSAFLGAGYCREGQEGQGSACG